MSLHTQLAEGQSFFSYNNNYLKVALGTIATRGEYEISIFHLPTFDKGYNYTTWPEFALEVTLQTQWR